MNAQLFLLLQIFEIITVLVYKLIYKLSASEVGYLYKRKSIDIRSRNWLRDFARALNSTYLFG